MSPGSGKKGKQDAKQEEGKRRDRMTGGQHQQVIQQYNCDNYALLAVCVYVYGGLRDDSNDNEEWCDFL